MSEHSNFVSSFHSADPVTITEASLAFEFCPVIALWPGHMCPDFTHIYFINSEAEIYALG